MPYVNQTYRIPGATGGLNANKNIENLPPEAMVSGSKNINLHNGAKETRGGTSHFNSSAVTGTPQIMGATEYYKASTSTKYLVSGNDDGKIVTINTTGLDATLKTGLQTGKFYSFAEMNNKLYITNSYNTIQTWESAASTADLAAPAADWSAGIQPVQLIKHGYANSERLWGIGTVGKENFIYYSVNNDGVTEADFNGAGSGQLYIETGDGYGIVGAVDFQDKLFCFGKTETFIVLDTDASPANWGYQLAGWVGGVATHRLIAKTDNDVICMMDDGEVYSVTAVQSYGDYKRASITRPAYIHYWIQENVDLTKISQFHMIFDPEIRAIRIFVVRKGLSEVDTCLLYFIDRPVDQAWTVHDNILYDSGFNASSSWVYRDSTGMRKVYTGDYAGFVWKLEQSGLTDNGNAYQSVYKTPRLDFGDKRAQKKYQRVHVVGQSTGTYNYAVKDWVDGILDANSASYSKAATGALLDSFILDTDVLGGLSTDFQENSFDLGRVGKRLEIEISNNVAGRGFYIADILVDYKPLTRKP